jgi:hypothetical protein
MTPKGADLEATDLIEVSTIESGSYVTRSITGQELIDAIPLPPTGLTVGTTPIASGTIGRVLFQGTGNVLQQSSSLFWDSTNNRLGIGTSSPSQALDISGNINALNNSNTALDILTLRNTSTGNTNQTRIRFYNDSGASPGNGGIIFLTGNNYSGFPTNSFGFWNESANGVIALATNNTERLRLFSTGNIGINTTTDAGFRLDVNGTARVSGMLFGTGTFSSFGNVSNGYGGVGSNYYYSGLTGPFRTNADSASMISFDSGGFTFRTIGNGSANSSFSWDTRAILTRGGNLMINTTTDAGFRLDVNGTARFNGNLTFQTTSWVLDNGNAIMHRGGFNVESIAFNSSRMVFTDNNGFVFNGSNSSATLTASSIVDIQSTTKGFLPPRMTTTQKNAIASPATGLMVYDTTLNLISVYNGTTWITL